MWVRPITPEPEYRNDSLGMSAGDMPLSLYAHLPVQAFPFRRPGMVEHTKAVRTIEIRLFKTIVVS